MKQTILLAIFMITALSLCWAKGKEQARAEEITPREDKMGELIMVGLEITDTMEQEAYMKLWAKFFEISEKIPNAIGDAYYGVSFSSNNAEGKDAWGYMVAAEVKSPEGIPQEFVVRKIPARRYIVFEHKGPIQTISNLYQYIYGVYSQSGKHNILAAETLERYDHRYLEDSENSLMEIWVPIHSE